MERKTIGQNYRDFIMVVAMTISLASCSNVPETANSLGTELGPRLVLDLQPGPEHRKSQIAAWVETPGGAFIETIYVTAKGGRGSWAMAPRAGRPEALPVWSHARSEGSDIVTSATPAGSLVYSSPAAARLAAGNYVVWLEINRSFDYNERYSKGQGVGGQPSVVYKAKIRVGDGMTEAVFQPVGTGSADGSDGDVRPGLDGITTALELFSSLKVSYQPE